MTRTADKKTRDHFLSSINLIKLQITFLRTRLKLLENGDLLGRFNLRSRINKLKFKLRSEQLARKYHRAMRRSAVSRSPSALVPAELTPFFSPSSGSEVASSDLRTPVGQMAPGDFPWADFTPAEQMAPVLTTPPRLGAPVLFAGFQFPFTPSTPAEQMMPVLTTPPRLERPAALFASSAAWLPAPLALDYSDAEVDTDSASLPASLHSSTRSS